jgi:hypothetical protein
LLRLKRSIDEIFSLCEFESDEGLCKQVRAILDAASGDFGALIGQFDAQQEYALLPGEFPFKTGVAWTTRTPAASRREGESILEVLERLQLNSPSSASGGRPSGNNPTVGRAKGSSGARSQSLDTRTRAQWLDDPDAESLAHARVGNSCGGTGEAHSDTLEFSGTEQPNSANREDQLDFMVQSTLRNVKSRLGRPKLPLSPVEIMKRGEDRQRRAQQLRDYKEDQRAQQLRQLEGRIVKAKERREEREQQLQQQLLEKMTRARRQYQDQLRIICDRARNENRKSAEVAFMKKEAQAWQREGEIFKRNTIMLPSPVCSSASKCKRKSSRAQTVWLKYRRIDGCNWRNGSAKFNKNLRRKNALRHSGAKSALSRFASRVRITRAVQKWYAVIGVRYKKRMTVMRLCETGGSTSNTRSHS